MSPNAEDLKNESITINVNVPKAFLQNVVGYTKKTGHYNDLDEFVLEALREKIKSVKTLEEAIKITDLDLETAKETLKDYKTEIILNPDFFEDVTVKIPAAVMELLRHSQ